MRLNLDNVNLLSTSGPNSFANKLVPHLLEKNVKLDGENPDAHLCFIESVRVEYQKPMIQRLDGIYFNTSQDYNKQNQNIKRTYDMADGVVFQSNFNKELITKYFGEHKNPIVIHNGTDLEAIDNTPVFNFNKYESLWSCAASWRPHKRLSENIRYFLEHSGPNDGMIVAGSVDKRDKIKDSKVHYVGTLSQKQLYALYKRSDYFVHLAWLDHCPNVVVDARGAGCQIICSSAGGTKEIAGEDAIVVQEEEWDFTPVALYDPPKLNFEDKLFKNPFNKAYNIDISDVADRYLRFIKLNVKNSNSNTNKD